MSEPQTIVKWPGRGVARVASFPDGSTCEESAPIDGVVSRVVDPPIGHWQANAWAEGRARMMGGDAGRTVLGVDGRISVYAERPSLGRYGPVPDGYELRYHRAMYPGWVVESIKGAGPLSVGEVDNRDEGPYSAVLNAWEQMTLRALVTWPYGRALRAD